MPKKTAPAKKTNRTEQVRSLTHNILLHLQDVGEEILWYMPTIFEGKYGYVRRISGQLPVFSRSRVNQAVKRLHAQGWTEERTVDGKQFVKLTKQGKLEVLYMLLRLEGAAPIKTNTLWTLAFFDIPEESHLERDSLRLLLGQIGFRKLQNSVYIRPGTVLKSISKYLEEVGLLKFIRFAEASLVSGDTVIRQWFEKSKS